MQENYDRLIVRRHRQYHVTYCIICGIPFDSSRGDASYCGARCRKAVSRGAKRRFWGRYPLHYYSESGPR